MGYVPSDRCIINNCKKLPSGNYLLFDISKNTLDVSRYWSIPDYNKCSKNFHENDLACELEVLLEKSIKKQLMADVPVGVLLSGGVDSSLITAIASRSVKNLKTFTVRFSDFHSHDETKYARLIAKKFNTDHHEIDVSNIDPEILNSLARQFDEPIVDSSMIPTFLVSKLVKRHCKVVLGGDGADELFGGYEHYSRLLLMDSYTKFVPSPLLSLVSNFSEGFIPVGTKARNWLIGCNYKVGKDIPMIAKYFDKKNRRSLMSSAIDSWNTVAEDVYKSNSCLHGDIIQRATRTDFHNYLTEDILVKVDRASMLNSLEVRAPFLDKNIIEFAFGEVPSNLKATKHNKKIILKKIAEKILPVDFENTRKQGFSIPLNEWLKNGKFRDFFYSVLLDPNCIFDKKTINSLLKGQDKGRNNGERLFALVMFELWRKEYDVSI